jgi:hypothetical protein
MWLGLLDAQKPPYHGILVVPCSWYLLCPPLSMEFDLHSLADAREIHLVEKIDTISSEFSQNLLYSNLDFSVMLRDTFL